MKKKISKILGVGLSLALLTGLVAGLVPALAQDHKALRWEEPYQPGNWTQAATSAIIFSAVYHMTGPDIVDMSVSTDGNKVYVVAGAYNDFYKTVGSYGPNRHRVYTADYGGYLWTTHQILDEDGVALFADDSGSDNWSIDLVSQAPDDPDVVAIAVSSDNAATGPVIYYSSDGGTTWASLGIPTDTSASTAADTILCLDVGFLMGSKRYIMAGGLDGAAAGLWYFNLGGTIPSWVDAAAATSSWDVTNFEGAEAVWAAKFSPTFPSDRTVVVVTGPEGTGVDTKVRIQLASFAGKTWNSDFYGTQWEVAGVFGREIESIDTGTVVQAASISMPDSYMGSDESTRVAFIGLATNDSTGGSPATLAYIGNIYRFDDYKRTRLLGDAATYHEKIKSVAISPDGANLVAGEYSTNNIIRSANPLVKEPDCYDSQSLKRPGSNTTTNKVIVAWGGSDVKAGTAGVGMTYPLGSPYDRPVGDASGFSVSADLGKSFNDIGFIDSHIMEIEDFFITDGGYPYVVSNDGVNLSFWKGSPYSPYFWTRTLTLDADMGYIMRVAPEDNNVIYLAQTGQKRIYYTSDGGDTQWLPRYCGVAVQDMAVESADVVYAINTLGKVSKSTDGGFVWSSPATDSKQTSGHTIVSLAEDQLLVTSTGGGVSYSKDGNATWTTMTYTMTGATNAQVVATGFETGDFLFGVGDGSNNIFRWTYGTNTTAWTVIGSTTDTSQGFYGLALVDGVLYAASSNGTTSYMVRHLEPTLPEDQVEVYWDESQAVLSSGALGVFNTTPQALRVGSDGMVWAADTSYTAATAWPSLFRYEDSLAAAGPTLSLPPDEMNVPANRETGIGYNVILTWAQQSRATSYELDIAYDGDFSQVLVDGSTVANADLLDTVIQSTGPLALELVPGITYYWRVKAVAPLDSPWSEAWSFTVQTLTAAQQALEPPEVEEVLEPVVSGPAFGADDTSTKPTFTWTAVAGATYEFVLAEELGLDDPFEIIDYSATCDINAHVAREDLKYSTTYHWRVRAITADATGDWVRGIFTTAAAPPEPVEPAEPVIIEQKPAEEIYITMPAAPSPVQVIPDWALYTIIVVGAVLVISVIVLIVRTRRVV